MPNQKRLSVTVTEYEGHVPFPEAEHYPEYCASRLAETFGAEVEVDLGLQTRVSAYGFGSTEAAVCEDVSRLVKVDLWDDFCSDGYQQFSGTEG